MHNIKRIMNLVFLNIQKKKNVALAMGLAIFMFVCTVGIFNNYKKNHINIIMNDLEFESRSYGEYFQKGYNTNCIYFESIGNLTQNYYERLDNIEIDEIKDTFNTINTENGFVGRIYFVDNETGTGVNGEGFVNLLKLYGDLRNREWYKEAVLSNESVLSDVYEDINTHKPCITMSYAVRNQGKLLGVLAADIFVEDLNEYYTDMLQEDGINFSVVSEDGFFIINNNEKLLGRFFDDMFNEYKNEESDYNWDEISNKKSGDSNSFIYKNHFISAYYPINSNLKWTIFCTVDYSKMIKNVNKTLYIFLLIGLVVYLFVFIFLLLFKAKHQNTDRYTGFMQLSTFGKMIEYNNSAMKSQFLLFIDIKNHNCIKRELNSAEYEEFMEKYSQSIRQVFQKSFRVARGREGILIISPVHPEIKHFKNTISKAFEKFNEFEVNAKGDIYKLKISFYLVEYSKEDLVDFTKKLIISEETIIKKDYIGSELINLTYDELIEKSREDMRKLEFLRTSIENSRIVPFYQPIVDVLSNEIVKYEVLMRIKDGDNYLSPYPYILIAEKYNIIESVDLMVLEKALELKKKTDKEDKLIFSFNLSGKLLNDKSYLRRATAIVDKYSINHNKIDFEITETEKLYDIRKTNEILTHYMKKGYGFSVDDFGTAYASIAYLKHIPANIVKIDGSFIKDIDKNEENYYLVKSMIAMAKGYKKKTVAEFVETEEVYNKLVELGIDLVQGYYFGKPSLELQK